MPHSPSLRTRSAFLSHGASFNISQKHEIVRLSVRSFLSGDRLIWRSLDGILGHFCEKKEGTKNSTRHRNSSLGPGKWLSSSMTSRLRGKKNQAHVPSSCRFPRRSFVPSLGSIYHNVRRDALKIRATAICRDRKFLFSQAFSGKRILRRCAEEETRVRIHSRNV